MTIPRRKPRFYRGQRRDMLGFILGLHRGKTEDVGRFEEKLASYIGRKFAVATCSGRGAMEIILNALSLKSGDEVIVPAYTLKDLIVLMKGRGIAPVLVDVDAGTFNIDPSRIEEKITPATKAIIATHIFGVPCAVDKIKEIASRHGLRVIEDCAHSIGAFYGGKRTGSFGDAAFFSFETIKLVNTFGGGAVVTDDEGLAAKARAEAEGYPSNDRAVRKKMLIALLEDIFIRGPVYTLLMRLFVRKERVFTRFYWSFRSGARVRYSRYTPIQANMAVRQMDMLDVLNERRARSAEELEEALPAFVLPQRIPKEAKSARYFCVARLSSSRPIEDIRRDMLKMGVDCGIREEITDNCALNEGCRENYPVTSTLYDKNIQLPMYDGLSGTDIRSIVAALSRAAK